MSEVTPDSPKATTAFVVVLPPDGVPYAMTNVAAIPEFERQATPAEVRRICQDVADDLNAQAAAAYTLRALKALKEAAEEEKPSARVQQALNKRRKR